MYVLNNCFVNIEIYNYKNYEIYFMIIIYKEVRKVIR